MGGDARSDIIAKFIADPASPETLRQKVQAGYLPCRGTWLKQSDLRARRRRQALRRYVVRLELLVLLAAIVGFGFLTWALLRLLCCT